MEALRCNRCWRKKSLDPCFYTEGHDFVNEDLWWAIRSRCEIQEPHAHGNIAREYVHPHDTRGKTLQLILDLHPYWAWIYVKGTAYWKEVKCDKDLEESPLHRVEENKFVKWTHDQCHSCGTKYTSYEYKDQV